MGDMLRGDCSSFGLEDLAATDFPAAWAAVSWALEVFTVEFGMGSGVVPPPWPPGRPNHGSVAGFSCQPSETTAGLGWSGGCVFLTSGDWGLVVAIASDGKCWMSAVEAWGQFLPDDWRLATEH